CLLAGPFVQPSSPGLATRKPRTGQPPLSRRSAPGWLSFRLQCRPLPTFGIGHPARWTRAREKDRPNASRLIVASVPSLAWLLCTNSRHRRGSSFEIAHQGFLKGFLIERRPP